MKFSVLLSVYLKERSENLKDALESVVAQTLKPDEIILVVDGPITSALRNEIDLFKDNHPNLLTEVNLKENTGLGNALGVGLQYCQYDLVARMDTDDIAQHTRFEKQIAFLKANENIAVVGSNVEEFNKIPGDLQVHKQMPECGKPLLAYAKYRNPLNHPSIIFRKAAVLASGSYDNQIPLFEDYSLFIRMLKNGYEFYNIQEDLVYFRVGDGLENIKRRSGMHYVRNEIKFLTYAYRIHFLTSAEFCKSFSAKILLRLFPGSVVLWFYKKFLRRQRNRS